MSLNRVSLIGNLGRDPEVRTLQDGKVVATVSIATSEKWTDKNTGEKKENTEWHRVVIWGRTGEVARDYLRKGSKCYVEGKLQTRKWTDKSGVEKFTTEVVLSGAGSRLVLLDRKDGGGGPPPPQSAPDDAYGRQAGGAADPDDSEIPF